MEDQKVNALGFDEVVDTAVDVLEVSKRLEEALSDGLDLGDIAAVFSVAPRLVEVYRDRNVFVAQLADLTPDESRQAAIQIAQQANLPADGIFGKVNAALILLARTHQVVDGGIDLAQDWLAWGKSLAPKTDDAEA